MPTSLSPAATAPAIVFGASGFLGSHVAEQLRLAGHSVLAPTRRQQPFLQALGVRQHLIDFQDDAALMTLIPRDSVVYCCLANPRRHLAIDDLRAVEVRLTERIIRIAAQAGARRVVLLSTVMVHGFERPPVAIDESASPVPLHPFCRVALEREHVAQQTARDMNIELLILRPTTAIGARDQQFAQLIQSFRRGVFPRIGHEDYRFSAMDARDIGRAMQWLGALPLPKGETPDSPVWLAKGFDTSWQEVQQMLERLTGRHAHTLRIPLPLARGLGSLIETVCPYRWEPKLTRFSVDTLSTHLLFDTSRLRQTGFETHHDLQDALRAALESIEE